MRSWQHRKRSLKRKSDARLCPMQTPIELAGRPPFEVVAPGTQRLPMVFNSPHSGHCYPRGFPRRLAPRRARHPPLRGQLRRRAVPAGGRARRAAPARELPARLARREPRALRARPEDVRRQPARPTPTSARSGSPAASARSPASSRRARRSTPARSASTKGLPRIDAVYKPYHRTLRELLVETHRAASASPC